MALDAVTYGVTDDGYVVKGLDVVLAESLARARAAFGPDVDLTATSPLRKILEVSATEDAELWKRLETAYYAGFVSTADGASLDLLGEDIGVGRLELHATGAVTLTLTGGVPGREYFVNEATVLTAGPGGALFTTSTAATLTAAFPTATVPVVALPRGPAGDVAAAAIDAIEPAHAAVYFADRSRGRSEPRFLLRRPRPCRDHRHQRRAHVRRHPAGARRRVPRPAGRHRPHDVDRRGRAADRARGGRRDRRADL